MGDAVTGSRGKGKGTQNGGGRRPVDSETRRQVVEMATTPDERGRRRSRNAIAKALGLSTSTVTRIVQEDGPEGFTWLAQAAAVTAQRSQSLDLRTRRAGISAGLVDDVERMRRMLWQPMERSHVAFGEVTRWESPPDPNELRNIAIALGVLVDKHLVLARFDGDDLNVSAVDAWLDSVMPGAA
jgi:hypothetical protein